MGYDDEANPDGFIAVHKEMMEKSRQSVIHKPIPSSDGLVLSLDHLKHIREIKLIHMPINNWYALFDRIDGLDEREKLDYQCLLGEISLDSLMVLRHDRSMFTLLDPKDSTQINPKVCDYSRMLREVLHNVQDTNDLGGYTIIVKHKNLSKR